ncbi:MAG: PDZ domain-containing protein [Gammaproteobacteria bacterium]|nr:PDZ domain-containing protein [Gammaproteobacteria bacterium]
MIHYKIQPSNPAAHVYSVTVSIPDPAAQGQRVYLPSWIPGSYMIRDFSRNIVSISAFGDGQPVELHKLDKASWQAPAGLNSLTIQCEVYAWDLSVRAAHLDCTHAFFNGTSVFLGVEGQEDQFIELTIEAPSGEAYTRWELATGLTPLDVDERRFGVYQAADYDELIDHPVEMGTFERVEFVACGVKHELVLTGRYHTDTARIASDLARICETQIRFFGEPAPVEQYLFLVMVVGDGYGGLEHRNSTALLVSRSTLPVPGDSSISDGYLQFLGLCSHEYFHTWNVKRIKPAQFIPYQLKQESYTRLLWFFEGMTSYYDDLMLLRCGLIDQSRYLSLLSKTITRVQRGAGRLRQSVAESSFDAWHKFYKQDENAPNAIVSYYAKGALVAMCLDAKMRDVSNHTRSLDTLMHTLWSRWLKDRAGIDEHEPERVASELCNKNLTDFLEPLIYGCSELPLTWAVTVLGLECEWRQRTSMSDTGGESATSKDTYCWFGANVVSAPGGVKITHVFNDYCAESAGLAAGDVIVAIDHCAINLSDLDSVLQRYSTVGKVVIHYFRHQELCQTELRVVTGPRDTCSLKVAVPDTTNQWLYSVTV